MREKKSEAHYLRISEVCQQTKMLKRFFFNLESNIKRCKVRGVQNCVACFYSSTRALDLKGQWFISKI